MSPYLCGIKIAGVSGGSRISQRGCANPREGGAPTYYSTIFSGKLHENENILAQRGCASLVPLRFDTGSYSS